jgi:hypothetical protein
VTDPRGSGPTDRPGPSEDAQAEVPPERGRRRSGPSVGTTIGGILVGFDEQVWRRQPPAHERVQQVDRAMTVVTPGGLTIELPDGGAASDPQGPSTPPEVADDPAADGAPEA